MTLYIYLQDPASHDLEFDRSSAHILHAGVSYCLDVLPVIGSVSAKVESRGNHITSRPNITFPCSDFDDFRLSSISPAIRAN